MARCASVLRTSYFVLRTFLMSPSKSLFVCAACGSQSPKWLGRCPDCGEWNTFAEEAVVQPGRGATRSTVAALGGSGAKLYAEVDSTVAERLGSGSTELDRVLGGGLVPGSLVLLGGAPGIGKSTLRLLSNATPGAAAW